MPRDAAKYGVVLAVSGGADSVALARMFCKELDSCALKIAHFHHNLRGAEADSDAEFVKSLARDLNIAFVMKKMHHSKTPAAEKHAFQKYSAKDDSGSIEATLRAARYDFLCETAESLGFRYVATAHTRDDQVETILHRIVRGTGVAGLVGMSETRRLSDAVTLVRPLLQTSRDDLRAWLKQIQQPFCEDSSNLDERFTRNRIRHTLLPLLRREFNVGVDDGLLRLATHAAFYHEEIAPYLAEKVVRLTLSQSAECVVLNRLELQKFSPAAIAEMFIEIWKQQSWPLRAMGQTQWIRLARFISEKKTPGENCSTAKMLLPGKITVDATHDKIILSLALQ